MTLPSKCVEMCLSVLLPLLIVGALQLNNHLYYDLMLGYDMPQHLDNTISVMRTGQMPQMPLSPYEYEAHQAPLFYVLSAWILRTGEQLSPDPFGDYMPAVLFGMAMILAFVVCLGIRRGLRRLPPLLQGLVASVILVFPAHTRLTVMYSNDLPITLFATWAVFVLWLMCRTNRLLKWQWWLGAAALCGLAVAFKHSGSIVVGTYLGLAGCVGLHLWQRGEKQRLPRLIFCVSLGLPLMLIPWGLNAWNTHQYLGNPVGILDLPNTQAGALDLKLLTNFDVRIFDMPFAFGPGESSFWTMQYVTLHSDYYNHWNSPAYEHYPASEMLAMPHRFPMPYTRFYDALMLQWLALPISGIMLLGLGRSIFRVVSSPRHAFWDGSMLALLFTTMTQAALLVVVVGYGSVRAAHARYGGFLYGFLFMIGVEAAYRWLVRQGKTGKRLILLLAAVMAAYVWVAVKFMWLPPL